MKFFLVLLLATLAHAAGPTDDEIKQQMIKQSIAAYSGHCPCPYSIAKNGSKCGKRSAYSRPRGKAPLCFKADITQEMLEKAK